MRNLFLTLIFFLFGLIWFAAFVLVAGGEKWFALVCALVCFYGGVRRLRMSRHPAGSPAAKPGA